MVAQEPAGLDCTSATQAKLAQGREDDTVEYIGKSFDDAMREKTPRPSGLCQEKRAHAALHFALVNGLRCGPCAQRSSGTTHRGGSPRATR